MFKRILVPVDGSDTSSKALTAALQLARESGGGVRIIHSLDELAYMTGYEYSVDVMRMARDQASGVLQQSIDVATAAGIPTSSQVIEAPGKRLGDVVADDARSWNADLIVVGTHGRRGIGRVVLGSGAEQVLRMAPVPVLVIRGGDTE